MTHATEAAAALCTRAVAEHKPLAAAVQAYRIAYGRFGAALDLMDVFDATAMLVLAAEDMKDAAKRLEETARAALAETMRDTGCAAFRTATHVVSLGEAARSAVITDPDIIPPEFLIAPKPDRAAIAKALRSGQDVPGATLNNGGTQFVQFHARKDAAA